MRKYSGVDESQSILDTIILCKSNLNLVVTVVIHHSLINELTFLKVKRICWVFKVFLVHYSH